MIKTILYHYPLSPFCRKIRVMLAEKGCLFEPDDENIPDYLFGEAPLEQPPLLIDDENYIFDHEVITEYIDEKYPNPRLMGNDVMERVEIRRLCRWFDEKFYSETGGIILREKLEKRLRSESPDSVKLLRARKNLKDHLFYISHLLRKNDKLSLVSSDIITMADITAAAHLSVLDYFGEISWYGDTEKNVIDYTRIRDWYMRIKSRQSFRPLLADRVTGVPPYSANYSKLDFGQDNHE